MTDDVIAAREKYADSVTVMGVVAAVNLGWCLIEFFASSVWKSDNFNFKTWTSAGYLSNFFFKLIATTPMIVIWLMILGQGNDPEEI